MDTGQERRFFGKPLPYITGQYSVHIIRNKQYSYYIAKVNINQDLSYNESLSGQPEAWLVNKIFFRMHAINQHFLKNTSYLNSK